MAFRAGIHEDDLRDYLRREIAAASRAESQEIAVAARAEVEPVEEFDWSEILKEYSPEELASYGIIAP